MDHQDVKGIVAALALGAGLTMAGGGAVAETLEPLPRLSVDLDRVSVSGLSSGAFMAVQMQTAFSSDIMGAAIFAGGPFGCARGDLDMPSLTEAITHCVNIDEVKWLPVFGSGSYLSPPEVKPLVAGARRLEKAGAIDPLSGLEDDRIYLFSGTVDNTVPQGVMTALRQWYAEVAPGAQVVEDFGVDAGHAMITSDWKNACPDTELPFINNCNLDGAEKALTTIYGPLKTDADATGRMIAFDQQAYVPTDAPAYNGLHEGGHLFVPDACANGTTSCGLHVVFHGCEQNQDFIGDQYWTRTGYNDIAAANDIILLYPQTKASHSLPNPKGCWDWWGFTDKNALEPNRSYLTRGGTQMRAIRAMMDQVSGRSNQ